MKTTIITIAYEGELPAGTILSAITPDGMELTAICQAGGSVDHANLDRLSTEFLVKCYCEPMGTAVFNRLKELQ